MALCGFSRKTPPRITPSYVEREEGAPGPSGPVAFVNIMQGCDNFCAYCIVPFTRGRQKSRGAAAVLDDCRRALDGGAREICLLGQNVNAFSRDGRGGGDGVSFADLLRRVAALPGLIRLRYVTPHPRDMGPEDVALFGELPQNAWSITGEIGRKGRCQPFPYQHD